MPTNLKHWLIYPEGGSLRSYTTEVTAETWKKVGQNFRLRVKAFFDRNGAHMKHVDNKEFEFEVPCSLVKVEPLVPIARMNSDCSVDRSHSCDGCRIPPRYDLKIPQNFLYVLILFAYCEMI